MSKSDNIYNALDFARNKLKSATEAKGAAVASPYSLMDIAAAVQTIENGLEVGVLVSDSTGLKVQPLEFSGTTATANGAAESYAAKIFNTGKAEPAYSSGGDTSAKTWSGYEAVFDSTAGTWSFESDVTAGLAYNFMTPSVGGVYDADCTMTASLDTGEISLLTPHIMTDASDGEWTVTASAQESDHNRAAWKVFDGRFGENYGWSGYPNTTGWLMVEHTTPFTVKRLKLSSGSMYYGYNGTLTISGSNTGNDFTDIWSGDNPINGSNYNTNDYQEIDLSTNTLPYKFLKLYWKGVSNRLYLGELEIWGR